MSAPYLETLDDLAAKRRSLGDVIVALAQFAGVDPAPYLDRLPAVTDADVDTVVDRLRTARKRKAPAPPRPQRPAPPSTNGAGLDDKVLQVLEGGPQAPKAISDRLKVAKWKLKPVFQRMVAAKQITASGQRRGLKYQLA